MKKRSGKKVALGKLQPPAAKIGGSEYGRLLTEIKDRVRAAQYEALRAVNRELVALYWDIGRLIVERQAGQSWGRSVVQRLAADLQTEFPGIAGFSASNLWRIKGFYEDYASSEKLAPLVREIAWSHNLVILCKEKRRIIVEYALRDAHRPIGVVTYRIVRRLPRELQGQLPSPQQIGKLLEGVV